MKNLRNFIPKYYHPTNSYIFLYGNCDMEERMNWLDQAYLSKFEEIDFDTTIQYQKPFEKPCISNNTILLAKEAPLQNKKLLIL